MALRDQPYFPLYVQDFLTDEKLNCCSLSTQGVYIRIICALHKSETYGGILFKQIPKQNLSSIEYFVFILSKQIGIREEDVRSSLEELIFFDVVQIEKKEGVDFLFQKRMVKDFEISLKRSKSAKKGGGNPGLKRLENTDLDEVLFKQHHKQNPEYEDEYDNENKNDSYSKYLSENSKFHLSDDIDRIKEKFFNDDSFRNSMELLCMNSRNSKDRLIELANEFNSHLVGTLDTNKSPKEWATHFRYWVLDAKRPSHQKKESKPIDPKVLKQLQDARNNSGKSSSQ